MNQEKIGKFIQELRKEKKLTQTELGEKLGVTDRSISNWENGKCMPDLSLFKPLCEELGITINELMSGERIDKDNYQNKLEENIINTIDYSSKNYFDRTGYLIFNTLGFILFIISCLSWSIPGNFQIIGALVGIIFIVIAINKVFRKKIYKILLSIIIIIILLLTILFIDYVMVSNYYEPKIYLSKNNIDNITIYKVFNKSILYCDGKITVETEDNRIISKEEAIKICENHLNLN